MKVVEGEKIPGLENNVYGSDQLVEKSVGKRGGCSTPRVYYCRDCDWYKSE